MPPSSVPFILQTTCAFVPEHKLNKARPSNLVSPEGTVVAGRVAKEAGMKTLATFVATFLVSLPLLAQTSMGTGTIGAGVNPTTTTTTPATGAQVFDPGNTAIAPPATLNSTPQLNGPGTATTPTQPNQTGFGTGFGTGTSPSLAPIPPATTTVPGNPQRPTNGWQGI